MFFNLESSQTDRLNFDQFVENLLIENRRYWKNVEEALRQFDDISEIADDEAEAEARIVDVAKRILLNE